MKRCLPLIGVLVLASTARADDSPFELWDFSVRATHERPAGGCSSPVRLRGKLTYRGGPAVRETLRVRVGNGRPPIWAPVRLEGDRYNTVICTRARWLDIAPKVIGADGRAATGGFSVYLRVT